MLKVQKINTLESTYTAIKAAAKNKNIICIGTSATMATGTIDEQKKEVAKVATRFFDTDFDPESVIVESLTYSTSERIPSKESLVSALKADINDSMFTI